MIELRPPGVTLETKAQPRILLPDHWVKFSDKFPDALKHVKGKTMRVTKQVQVTFPRSWIIKENCYVDVNLSNEDTGEKLYPEAVDNLYEMLIGLKPGNWYLIPYFPAEQPVYRLDQSDMRPLLSDGKLRYLGNVRPEDSPPENKSFRIYLVYQLTPVILRLVCDGGVDYEKCTLDLLINRCQLLERSDTNPMPDYVTPKRIEYLDELKW